MTITLSEFSERYGLGDLAEPFYEYLSSLKLQTAPMAEYDEAELRALLLTFIWQRLDTDSQQAPGYWRIGPDALEPPNEKDERR